MSNTDEIRWKQRLQSFNKANSMLQEGLLNPVIKLSKLEQEGVIQRFEYTFELAWKTLKDLLFYEGYDAKSPREVLRQAFESEYLSETDTEILLDALNKRNLLSHTYEEATAQQALHLIEKNYSPVLNSLNIKLNQNSEL